MIDRRIHGPIHEIRLDRPPVNALSPELLIAIAEEVSAAPENGARALVLSGREGLFSAGLDVPLLVAMEPPELRNALDAFFGAMEDLKERAGEFTHPVLFQHGGADRLCSPGAAREFYENIASEDKQFIMYDGLYHEVYNEYEKEEILAAALRWIEERLPAG